MNKIYSAYSSKFTIRFIICCLTFSILLTGCYSYYVIPKDDYDAIDKMSDVKVVCTNGKEFVIEKDDTTNINIVGDSLIIHQGAEMKIIQMSEVEKLKENRFDLGGTIAISIVALTILIVVFLSTFSFKS